MRALRTENVAPLVHVVREEKVLFDADLAALYGVTTKALNQAVKRNLERFPSDFMFRLTDREWAVIRSQPVTASTTAAMRSRIVTTSRTALGHRRTENWHTPKRGKQ